MKRAPTDEHNMIITIATANILIAQVSISTFASLFFISLSLNFHETSFAFQIHDTNDAHRINEFSLMDLQTLTLFSIFLKPSKNKRRIKEMEIEVDPSMNVKGTAKL